MSVVMGGEPIFYSVSGTHPQGHKFHGFGCPSAAEARAKIRELEEAGYLDVTVEPPFPDS